MKTVRIAGVPEHFNLPWQLCIEHGDFEAVGIDLQWTNIPEGTGKMIELLEGKQTDLAVILTEGIVKAIASGNPSQIVQEYIASPLLWGIHTAASAAYCEISELEHKKIAISRFGSGSHLMAIVHAKQRGWDLSQLEFVVVNTIDGAVTALENGSADYFMWERFMTQPLVDRGVFKRLGECPTPWPSFVVVAHCDFLQQHSALVNQILEIVNTTTAEFKYIPSIDRTLASRFDQELTDIQHWMRLTTWSQKQLSKKHFEGVQNELLELKLIDNKLAFDRAVQS